MTRSTLSVAICLALAGCTPAVGVDPPSPELMKRSPVADKLPAKTGMRALYAAYIKLKGQYGRARDREAGLQRYTRTVTR